jgi:hypothetical protein
LLVAKPVWLATYRRTFQLRCLGCRLLPSEICLANARWPGVSFGYRA